MNYRHHFHAGNFADVMKHALWLALIRAAQARGNVSLVETHAGAGLYDLRGEMAVRSNEAEAGIGRLRLAGEAPAPLMALKAAVARENPGGELRLYPGSPLLAVGAMRPGDRYLGCELRDDDFASLKALLAKRGGQGRALQADGYAALAKEVKGGDLVLIDPPYERGDDYDRAAEAVALCLKRKAGVALWAPIKDLETLDALVRRIESLRPQHLVLAEVRLRPLTNPMSMNGSAMLLVDAPEVTAEADSICQWVAQACGQAGARGGAGAID